MGLSQRIKGLRAATGLTQVALAKLVGITQPAISSIESGDTKELSGDVLAGMCRALRTNPEYLSKGIGNPGPLSVVTIEHKELLDIWDNLDAISREVLITSARALLDRQSKGRASIANPYPKKRIKS